MKIWYRYLITQLIHSFLFLLFSILVLYVVIDFSMRGVKILSNEETSFLSILLNYLRQFTTYFDLFISISFLLSSLKVLVDCNTHQELISLQMAGLSKKKLLTPFFSLATLLFFASYANHQWLSPDAGNEAHAFRETISSHKKSKKEKVFSLSLKDDSELVYQNYSQETKELSDVYWIRSPDNIWHMKCLKINTKPPLASFADHLIRNNQGQFEKDESFALRSFPELPWEKGVVLQKFIPFENRSLTTLFKQAFSFSSERHALFSHLYYKLALAWIPFIILLSIAPRVFFFSRGKSFFLFVAYSLFVLLGFITLLNGMLILSENQVLFPSVAIWGPVALALFLTIRPFWRLL